MSIVKALSDDNAKGKKGSGDATLEVEDGDGEFDPAITKGDEAVEVESPRQFRNRMEKKVSQIIYDAVKNEKKNKSEDQGNAAYAARKRLINEFIKSVAAAKRCSHCNA